MKKDQKPLWRIQLDVHNQSHSDLFVKKTPSRVVLTDKGHMELMTDFEAGKIFENLRTKDGEKGQRQVSLFWAWDDSKNVRNFSMLIIMAACGAAFDFFLSRKYICSSIHHPPSLIARAEQIEDKKMRQHSIFQCVAVRAWQTLSQTWKKMQNVFLLQSHFGTVCRVVRLGPASKCRSFGKTESWASRIITLHFSNWAFEAKQFQNLSPPPPPPPPARELSNVSRVSLFSENVCAGV